MYTYELSDNLAETFDLAMDAEEWWQYRWENYGPHAAVAGISRLLRPPSER